MRRAVLALAASAALAAAVGGGAAPPSVEPSLEAVLEEQRQKLRIAGLAFVAVKGDEVIALRALGLRDVARKAPATPDTLFPIGSCTKAFTALALAAAQDAGALTLDDRPHRYLPYFKMADPEADALVTLRDMLSHRTGLKAYADLAAEPGVLTREEYVRAVMPWILCRKTLAERPDFVRFWIDRALTYPYPIGLEGLSRQAQAIMGHDTRSRLGQICVPTLITTGTEDILVPPASSRELQAGIPGSSLQPIEDAGHLHFIEQAERFNAICLDFLTKHRTR